MIFDKAFFKGIKGHTFKQTGILGLSKPKVNPEHTMWIISDEHGEGVKVIFNEPKNLTIFEHDLLYCLFFFKKKPRDYANYHKCIAGQKFFDSIEKVWVLRVVPHPEITEELVLARCH